jgi:hypothetical protein
MLDDATIQDIVGDEEAQEAVLYETNVGGVIVRGEYWLDSRYPDNQGFLFKTEDEHETEVVERWKPSVDRVLVTNHRKPERAENMVRLVAKRPDGWFYLKAL